MSHIHSHGTSNAQNIIERVRRLARAHGTGGGATACIRCVVA